MKKGILKLIAVVLMVCCMTGAEGQNMLNVKDKSGVKTAFPLKDITKITFSSGFLNVNTKKDTLLGFFAMSLNNIQNLNFYIFTDIPELSNPLSDLTLFPNPAKENIHIQYTISTTEQIRLRITDILGKTVYEQELSNQPGTNNVIVSVSGFRPGLYLCRLQAGAKALHTKFLKN